MAHGNKGKIRSSETKKKISESKKGTPAWNKGKKGCFTESTLAKMRLARVGKVLTEEQKLNHSIGAKKAGVGKWMIGRKLSEEHKKNIGGRKPWNWIEVRSELAKGDNEYRNSPAHKEWSRSIKNRDGWKCKISNDDCSGKVVAHHILTWKDYPELRYEVNNGITLCHAHHPRKRNEEKELAPFFQEMVFSKA